MPHAIDQKTNRFLNNSKERYTKFQVKCTTLIALNSRELNILKLVYLDEVNIFE